MKIKAAIVRKPPRKCPPVIGIRVSPDNRLLLEAAHKDGMGWSWSDIGNTIIREYLMPHYGGKAVLNAQKVMGIRKEAA